ncbi:MAG: hypothetical protein AB4050_20320 [Synechococcus sp.]
MARIISRQTAGGNTLAVLRLKNGMVSRGRSIGAFDNRQRISIAGANFNLQVRNIAAIPKRSGRKPNTLKHVESKKYKFHE